MLRVGLPDNCVELRNCTVQHNMSEEETGAFIVNAIALDRKGKKRK